jgi:CheY-like chemotaxis protein
VTSTTRARILVMDDDSAVLETARNLLEGGGFEVVTYSGPFNLVEAIAATAPDLVLLDTSGPLPPGDDQPHRTPVSPLHAME